MLSPQLLNSYVGKHVNQICLNGFTNPSLNHCAHFVSHVLNLSFGYTCWAAGSTRSGQTGANLRVHEVFAQCHDVYQFTSCPMNISGLIFVSKETNFRGTPAQLRNVPKKHIGIILNGQIWHYSNTRNQVVVADMATFINHYKKQQNALWFGALPRTARAIYWGQC